MLGLDILDSLYLILGYQDIFMRRDFSFEVIQAFEDNSSYINDITGTSGANVTMVKMKSPDGSVVETLSYGGEVAPTVKPKFQFIMLERPILLFRCLILMRITTCSSQKTFPFYQGRLFLQRGSQRYFSALTQTTIELK